MSRLTLIVAATKSNGIGQHGALPWRLTKEMKYFARITSAASENAKNAVVMGRKTWESIPSKFRPLANRDNIVISRQKDYDLKSELEAVKLVHSLEEGLVAMKNADKLPQHIFIIGGATLYAEALALPTTTPAYVDRILLTRILSPDFNDCDVFLQDFMDGSVGSWERAAHSELETWAGFEVPEGEQEEKGIRYEYQMWVRKVQ